MAEFKPKSTGDLVADFFMIMSGEKGSPVLAFTEFFIDLLGSLLMDDPDKERQKQEEQMALDKEAEESQKKRLDEEKQREAKTAAERDAFNRMVQRSQAFNQAHKVNLERAAQDAKNEILQTNPSTQAGIDAKQKAVQSLDEFGKGLKDLSVDGKSNFMELVAKNMAIQENNGIDPATQVGKGMNNNQPNQNKTEKPVIEFVDGHYNINNQNDFENNIVNEQTTSVVPPSNPNGIVNDINSDPPGIHTTIMEPAKSNNTASAGSNTLTGNPLDEGVPISINGESTLLFGEDDLVPERVANQREQRNNGPQGSEVQKEPPKVEPSVAAQVKPVEKQQNQNQITDNPKLHEERQREAKIVENKLGNPNENLGNNTSTARKVAEKNEFDDFLSDFEIIEKPGAEASMGTFEQQAKRTMQPNQPRSNRVSTNHAEMNLANENLQRTNSQSSNPATRAELDIAEKIIQQMITMHSAQGNHKWAEKYGNLSQAEQKKWMERCVKTTFFKTLTNHSDPNRLKELSEFDSSRLIKATQSAMGEVEAQKQKKHKMKQKFAEGQKNVEEELLHKINKKGGPSNPGSDETLRELPQPGMNN